MSNSQEAGIRPRSGDGEDDGPGLRIGSLFSGIGGLELGLEWAGLGSTVYQCELEPFNRAQLARHWPGVRRWEDVAQLDPAELPAADLVCGGFPCQDVSVAWARHGVGKGPRVPGSRSGLWGHMARVVEAQRPEWVVVENVAHGRERWLPAVLSDLGQLGYATLPLPVEARTVGAPHERARFFVLAHAHGFELRLDEQRLPRRRPQALRDEREEIPLVSGTRRGWWIRQAQPELCLLDDGLPRGLGRHVWRAYGNAVVPQVAEVVGWVIRELIEAGAQATREEVS